MKTVRQCIDLVFVGLLLASCLNCARKELVFDTTFSVNLARPGKDFRPEEPTPAQQEVLDKFGMPDFVRVYWDRQGEIVTLLAADSRLRKGKQGELKQTWIYSKSQQEITFVDEDHYSAAPLSDKVKTVCELGDPDQIQKREDRRGGIDETWTYYAKGLLYTFYNDKFISKQQFQPMGSFIKE